MEYGKLFSTLNQYKVRYLICGGLAVNIYGIPRMTADIDLLLDFEDQNVDNFENAIKLLSYKSSVPLSLKVFVNKKEREKVVKEKNMLAYSYFSSAAGYINLDVLLDVPVSFEEMWQSRTEKCSENSALPLVSLEHLIELKTYANRIQDQKDVLLLSKLLK